MKYADVSCPNCGAKFFQVHGTLTEAKFKSRKKPKVFIENCKCLNCGTYFNIVNGEVNMHE